MYLEMIEKYYFYNIYDKIWFINNFLGNFDVWLEF